MQTAFVGAGFQSPLVKTRPIPGTAPILRLKVLRVFETWLRGMSGLKTHTYGEKLIRSHGYLVLPFAAIT